MTELIANGFDLDIWARTVWGEARGERTQLARIAVAYVIRNRCADPRWPDRPAAVCMQKLQFSCWNFSDPNREKMLNLSRTDPEYLAAMHAALTAYLELAPDPIEGCNHYAVTGLKPRWSPGPANRAIGNHEFWQL